MLGRPPEENGIRWNRADKDWDSYQFLLLLRIPYTSEEKYSNDEPVCKKWNSQQILVDRNNWTTSKGDPEYSGRKKPTEISRIFKLA